MNESVFRRAYFFISLGIMFLLGAEEFEESRLPLAGTLSHLIALGFSLAGCVYYADAKGLPRRYGLFGLLHFLGFWILLCIPLREGVVAGVAE